jgi:hypothetical protein
MFCGLLRRRSCIVLTWRGWLVLFALAVVALLSTAKTIYPFLAVNAPVRGDILAAEGWLTDYAIQEAMAEFRRHSYRVFYVTGGPLERGAPLSEHKTFAELGASIAARFGMPANVVVAVPAPEVRQDRTFAAAVALRRWLQQHGSLPAKLDVVSGSTHARRTRLLYARAFGRETQVGVICIATRHYDSKRWWSSSAGVREVIDETFAYLYARFFFRPSAEESSDATNTTNNLR